MGNRGAWGNRAVRWAAIVAVGGMLAIPALRAQPNRAADPDAAEDRGGSSDVVVTGRRETSPAEVGRFVEAVLAETGNDRVARWADRICVNVEGFSRHDRDAIVDRIEEVATELNLRIAPHRRCEPSAYMVFTSDPGALLNRLERERPAFFGGIPRVERDAFAASDATVRWLSFAQLRGANGEMPFSFYVDPKSGGVERPTPGVRTTPSRLQAGTRMDLQSIFVVVDASKTAGIPKRLLIDYLTMVMLGNVRQQHEDVGAPSILALFNQGQRAGGVTLAGMTSWDESYLRSLYAGNWNIPANQRSARMRASMRRDLMPAGRGRGNGVAEDSPNP